MVVTFFYISVCILELFYACANVIQTNCMSMLLNGVVVISLTQT